MSAVKAKVFPGKIAAWLALLFILLATMAIGTSVTVAKTLCTTQNRAGENCVAAVRLCPAPNPQTPNLQRGNAIGRYDLTLDDTLATEAGTLVASTPASVPAMIGGAALATNGADNMWSGLQSLWSGQPTETYTQQAITAATGSSTAGIWGNVAIGIAGGNWEEAGATAAKSETLTQSIGDLRSAGLQDAHHVIQDAAVRDLPGYDTHAAPGVQLEGPSTLIRTPHYNATQIQRLAGGGTYGAERQIAYNALRAAGYTDSQATQVIQEADRYFNSIGVNENTLTRIPGNRR